MPSVMDTTIRDKIRDIRDRWMSGEIPSPSRGMHSAGIDGRPTMPIAYLDLALADRMPDLALSDGRMLTYQPATVGVRMDPVHGQTFSLPFHYWQDCARPSKPGIVVVADIKPDYVGHGELLHVSFSYRHHLPSWRDVVAIKIAFFGEEGTACQIIPPQSEYVNDHPYCLHLWEVPTDWGLVP